MPVDQNKAIVQNEGTEYELVPEGIYTVEVVDIELKEGVEGKFGKKDKFYFKMAVLDPESRATTLMHFTTTAYTSGFEGGSASKLYETACAIKGEKLDDTVALDVNTLIGGKLRVVVKHQGGKDGKTYSNITEVMKADDKGKALESLTKDEKSKMFKKSEDDLDLSDLSLDDLDSVK